MEVWMLTGILWHMNILWFTPMQDCSAITTHILHFSLTCFLLPGEEKHPHRVTSAFSVFFRVQCSAYSGQKVSFWFHAIKAPPSRTSGIQNPHCKRWFILGTRNHPFLLFYWCTWHIRSFAACKELGEQHVARSKFVIVVGYHFGYPADVFL